MTIFWAIRRGGIYAARCSHTGKSTYRVNATKGFPLWGKLSPQVTDEGCLPGVSPSSGAFRATFPPRGRLFLCGNDNFLGNP